MTGVGDRSVAYDGSPWAGVKPLSDMLTNWEFSSETDGIRWRLFRVQMTEDTEVSLPIAADKDVKGGFLSQRNRR